MTTLLIEHLEQLYTVPGPAPRIGRRQGDHAPVGDAAIACEGATIVAAGPTAAVRRGVDLGPSTRVIDGRGRSLVPGFVDPHTHVLFAGTRTGELQRRLAGATYAEIAAAGGGILSTVASTRAATEDQLVDATRPRLRDMLAQGTTTCEVKSGYGLDRESELRMLRAIRRLSERQPIDVVSTFMAAHAVPPEFARRQGDYVRAVIDDMLPAARDLADWCDVFCDEGFFSTDESRAVLTAAARMGLPSRIHADELADSGGAQVAADVRARSADHLVHVGTRGIAALGEAGVVATLLPAASFFLKLGRWAPARALIDGGVAVAFATDINPGGGLSPSMPFVMALACFMMGVTFEEALAGSTLNAAYALDRHDTVGSLEPGKQFDAVAIDGPAINLLRIGAPSIAAVIKRGEIVSGHL